MSTDPQQWWCPFKTVEPSKAIGAAEVFHVDLTPHPGREAEARAWLNAEELARWQGFGSAAAQRRFVLCRAALRAILGRRLSCDNESLAFGTARHGKPYATVEGQQVANGFSVSHSGAHGLIAVVASGRVGVDVQERAPRRNLEGLIRRVCSPQEAAELEHLNEGQQERAFFRLWAAKEALAKAHGQGLSTPLSCLEIPEAMRRGAASGAAQYPHLGDARWLLEDIGTEQFGAAVACDR